MKKEKNEKPTDDAMKGYNPADRDFQRTEKEVDNVSGSEKEALEKKQNDALKGINPANRDFQRTVLTKTTLVNNLLLNLNSLAHLFLQEYKKN